jgi:hypothetical protein
VQSSNVSGKSVVKHFIFVYGDSSLFLLAKPQLGFDAYLVVTLLMQWTVIWTVILSCNEFGPASWAIEFGSTLNARAI